MIPKKYFKYFFKVLEPESWVFIFFVFATLNVGNFKPYLLMVILLITVLYIVNRNLTSSVWLGFVMTYLMRKEKYFTNLFPVSERYLELGLRQPTIVMFVSFSDALLLLLLYLLVRGKYFKNSVISNFKVKFFPELIFLLIIITGSISSHFSFMTDFSWFWLFQVVKLITMFYFARILVKRKNIGKKTLEIIFLYTFISSLLVILQKLNGGVLGFAVEEQYSRYAGRFADEAKDLYRPGGFFWDSNLIASILTMMIPPWLVLSFSNKYFNKFFLWMCLLVGTLALIFTASRAAWVITILLIVFSFFYMPKKKYNLPIIIKKYWLGLVSLVVIFFGKTILQRMLSLSVVFKQGGGAIYRLRHFQIALNFLYEYPLGLGINVFQYAIVKKFDPQYYLLDSTPAHNLIAQVSSGFGLIGIVLFFWLFFRILRDKFSSTSDSSFFIRLSLLLATLGYLLVSQFYPWFYKTPISGIFWILLGTLYVTI